MHDLPTFRDPVRASRHRLFPRMRDRRRRLLAALSGALFGGLATGVTAQLVLMPVSDFGSLGMSLCLWAAAVMIGSLVGAPILKATMDRFDYRVSFYTAFAALLAGQVEAVLWVWIHLGSVLSVGVVSVLASAVVVLVVIRFTNVRAIPEPL
jgi:MFS family permease